MCEVSQESVANLLWDPKGTYMYAMDQRLPYLHEFVHVQRICMKHCIFTKVGITIGSMEMVYMKDIMKSC